MGPYGPHAKTPCTKTHLSSSRSYFAENSSCAKLLRHRFDSFHPVHAWHFEAAWAGEVFGLDLADARNRREAPLEPGGDPQKGVLFRVFENV